MKKVLITGATGALGQAVVEEIKKSNTYQIFTTTSAPSHHSQEITCDFHHLEQLTTAFNLSKPDLILHLGATFTSDINEAYRINVAPAAHILDLIYKSGAQTRMILIGSAAEYGIIKPKDNPVHEHQTLFPVSIYGISKAWQTQLLGLYASLGVDVICCRIFNLYGRGISDKLFAGRLQNQINLVKSGQKFFIEIGSLTAVRDYISTSEAARQLMMVAARGISGNIYHIASGIPITMRDFLYKELKLNGLSSSLVRESQAHSNPCGYDIPIIFANVQKTRSLESEIGIDYA